MITPNLNSKSSQLSQNSCCNDGSLLKPVEILLASGLKSIGDSSKSVGNVWDAMAQGKLWRMSYFTWSIGCRSLLEEGLVDKQHIYWAHRLYIECINTLELEFGERDLLPLYIP